MSSMYKTDWNHSQESGIISDIYSHKNRWKSRSCR